MSTPTSLPAQPSLFDRAPLASSADPVSSHIAASEHTSSGKRGEARASLLAFMQRQKVPLTSYEVSRAMGVDRHATARRLPDLANDGLVHRCAIRNCKITRRPAISWAAGPANGTTNIALPDIAFECRCGHTFTAPAAETRANSGSHCPSCRRFVQVEI